MNIFTPWLIILLSTALAHSQTRLALLIGNQHYQESFGQLSKPHQDVDTVAQALSQVGYGDVKVAKDLERDAMMESLRQFAIRVKSHGPDTIGFFYFSGHGASQLATSQSPSGRNFILPSNATEPNTPELWDSAIPMDEVTVLLRKSAPDADFFVVFDACRDGLSLSSKSYSNELGITSGLKQGGMLVAFATEDNHVAFDSGDYAEVLAHQILHPSQSHSDFFQNVRDEMTKRGQGRQIPTEINGFRQRVFVSAPEATRSAKVKIDPADAMAKPAAPTSPAVTFAKTAQHLPPLSQLYKAEFESPTPTIIRDNGTKLLVAWRIHVSYDRAIFDGAFSRVMENALVSVAKASAQGLRLSTQRGDGVLRDSRRVFGSNLEHEDFQSVEAKSIFTEASFGTMGGLEFSDANTDALFRSLNSAVGWREGHTYVLLADKGGVGGALSFKGYSVPIEVLPVLSGYAGGPLHLNVEAKNIRETELWSDRVSDHQDIYGVMTDIVRVMIRGDGPYDRRNFGVEWNSHVEGNVPFFVSPKADEEQIFKIGTDFRKAWLASGYNTPGEVWYSDEKRPTAVFLAPWFFLNDTSNPRGISDGFSAIYARWLTHKELDNIATMSVTVSGD